MTRFDLLDWSIVGLVAYGVMRMVVNKKYIEHTRYLIGRLRLVYGTPLQMHLIDRPISVDQLDRLLKCIASEGYGL
jgi:hypothetical protein